MNLIHCIGFFILILNCMLVHTSNIPPGGDRRLFVLPDEPGDKLPKLNECGDPGNHPKIIGGKEANLDEFPWMAVIHYERKNFGCAGSLITSKYVLTAAHCIDRIAIRKLGKPLYVHLGEHNITNDGIDCLKNSFGQILCNEKKRKIDIEKYIPYATYNIDDRYNDIGLIRLSTAVFYTDFIKPVCLPTNDITLTLKSSDYFTVAGWGRTETSTFSPVKLKVDVPYVALSKCHDFLKNISEKQICAGSKEGKDSCNGDSGGPLMTLSYDKRFHLDGIVSYGYKCGLKDTPAIYTKVFPYLKWIREHLEP